METWKSSAVFVLYIQVLQFYDYVRSDGADGSLQLWMLQLPNQVKALSTATGQVKDQLSNQL